MTAVAPSRPRVREWLAPAGLIALSLVPMLAGTLRLRQLAAGGPITSGDERFFDFPLPVIIHIVGSTVFLVLGAVQFVPSMRRHRWHRFAGRVAAPAGLLSALSALWMTLFSDLPDIDGPLLFILRVVLAPTMAGAIVVAFLAIRRSDVERHSAWMTRAYAIGSGAGTQALVFAPWTVLLGAPGQSAHDVLMGLAWAINLTVAEIVIRRRRSRSILSE